MDIRYSYAHVPTVREFAASNARVRGLSGPFRCLSGDTEFLTPSGWRRIDSFQGGDLVAQWRDGAISFVEPMEYIVDKATEFIEFSNRFSLTMRLSAGHRVPHYNWAGAFTVLTAAEIERHPSRRTLITTFDGHEHDALGMSDNLIRFAVMMHADGHYLKNCHNRATITVRKERKKKRIRELLNVLGVTFKESTYQSRPDETNFYFEPPYRGKRYAGKWWAASKRELAIVLDEMTNWDGLFDNDVSIFASAYKIDADYIQYAAHANGLRASISVVHYENPRWKPQHRVSVRMGDNNKNRACIREETTIRRVPSADGKMYCFTVPSGYFLARCSDSIFVTGNSGKSSGCVVEIVRRALAQKPGIDGIRRTRWLVVRSCFDDKTEILTEHRGWQLFRDLLPTDKVATLKDGKTLVYEVPSYYYSAHYKGEMVGIKHESLDFLVTPDHHLWTSKRATRQKIWQPYSHEKAGDAYGRTLRRMKRDAEWEGGSARYSESFYEFLGFWFAEGHAQAATHYPGRIQPCYKLTVVQKRNLGYVRDLLTRAGLRWGECISKPSGAVHFNIYLTPELKPLIAELASLGHAVDKYLPLWLKDSPAPHARAFLHGYIMGDGSYATKPHRVTNAATSSKRLANDIQELALKAGYVVNITKSSVRQIPGRFKRNCTHDYRMVFMTKKRREPATVNGWYKSDYDGMVYCVEVSSHVVYVRRNGKTVWCGQTYRELSDTTIRTVHMWLPPQHFGRYYQTDNRYVVKGFEKCEFEILFRALDKPDDIANLLSLEITGAWINEAREIPWAIVDAIQGRIEQYPTKAMGGCTWAGLFMDTNPPDQDSDWYRFFEEKQHPKWFAELFKQPSGLGPNAENIPNLTNPNYYKLLAEGKKPEWVKVYIHGEYGFVVDGKPVYDEYSDQLHRREVDPVPGRPIMRSFDWGLTPACCFSQLLPDGRWLVFDEMTSKNMGVDQFLDDVLEHCRRSFRGDAQFEDWGDPAGQQRAQIDKRTIFEMAATKGIDIQPSEQDPVLRMESVRKPLRTIIGGEPQFILHPRCLTIRKGFLGGYNLRRIQVAGPERYAQRPDKFGFSHIMNALEYGAASLFAPALTQGSSAVQDDWPSISNSEGSDQGRSEITGY